MSNPSPDEIEKAHRVNDMVNSWFFADRGDGEIERIRWLLTDIRLCMLLIVFLLVLLIFK